MARVIQNRQLQLGEVDISAIELDSKSRDDIPQILRGLQHLYCDKKAREKLFRLLPELVKKPSSWTEGRPGMTLWNIFVMGTLRVNLNWDYDRLHSMVNKHADIRAMLGHGDFADKYQYSVQSLKDNLKLFTPELLQKINTLVVETGQKLVVKKKAAAVTLHARCDSFVVETNVAFPIDRKLLLDAMRCSIKIVARACNRHGIAGWRQYRKHIDNLSKLLRKIPSRTSSCGPRQKNAYRDYLSMASMLLKRVYASNDGLEAGVLLSSKEQVKLSKYVDHAQRQIDQIERRVLQGEAIAHQEKVFSVFEDHTEWISKGKVGVPVELGVRVSVMEDQYGFILHHQVMYQKTDEKVAVPIVEEALLEYPGLSSCSFDRGYYSPANKQSLSNKIELTLPKKGHLSKKDQLEEGGELFKARRKQHPAIESAINALECHGLDRCFDRGKDGFDRYVAFAVVGRNLQQLGALLLDKGRRQSLMKKAA